MSARNENLQNRRTNRNKRNNEKLAFVRNDAEKIAQTANKTLAGRTVTR